MIVFKSGGHGPRQYSHIECDVPGCGAMSPSSDELQKKNLFELGWYLKDGTHRCPEHANNDVKGTGPVTRAADGSEGNVR